MQEDEILVVANLSRVPQYVELDLKAAFAGRTPVELTGHTSFPPITDRPYFLTLGPYAFHWFSLARRKSPAALEADVADHQSPTHRSRRTHGRTFSWANPRTSCRNGCPLFERPALVYRRRAAGRSGDDPGNRPGAGRRRRGPFRSLVQVEYSEGDPETYVLPLGFAVGDRANRYRQEASGLIVARRCIVTRKRPRLRRRSLRSVGQIRLSDGAGRCHRAAPPFSPRPAANCTRVGCAPLSNSLRLHTGERQADVRRDSGSPRTFESRSPAAAANNGTARSSLIAALS